MKLVFEVVRSGEIFHLTSEVHGRQVSGEASLHVSNCYLEELKDYTRPENYKEISAGNVTAVPTAHVRRQIKWERSNSARHHRGDLMNLQHKYYY